MQYKVTQDRVNRALQKKLFFVVGVPKSGTTWLQHVLNGHPNIYCGGESHFTNELAPLLQHAVEDYNKRIAQIHTRKTDYPQFTNENLIHLFITAIGLLYANCVDDPDVECIGDKTPDHMEAMPLLAQLFPSARFVHIIRDGRDMTVSAWFHSLRKHGEAFRQQHPELRSFAEVSSKIWASVVPQARAYGRSCPDRYYELRYEDLHGSPEAVIEGMLRFLKVDSSPSAVERCREAGSFERLSQGRIRGQEDQSAFYRKGIIGDWQNHFDQDCLNAFTRQAGHLLHELGYE